LEISVDTAVGAALLHTASDRSARPMIVRMNFEGQVNSVRLC